MSDFFTLVNRWERLVALSFLSEILLYTNLIEQFNKAATSLTVKNSFAFNSSIGFLNTEAVSILLC